MTPVRYMGSHDPVVVSILVHAAAWPRVLVNDHGGTYRAWGEVLVALGRKLDALKIDPNSIELGVDAIQIRVPLREDQAERDWTMVNEELDAALALELERQACAAVGVCPRCGATPFRTMDGECLDCGSK